MKNENWADIEGYEGLYQVSDHGRVKSLARKVPHRKIMMELPEKILVPYISEQGYAWVNLSKKGEEKNYQIHRLVLKMFVGPCPEGMECCHFPDKTRTNNTLSNLMWGTRQNNRDHLILQGSSSRRKSYENVPKGESHPHAKLDDQKVKKIRRMLKRGKRGDGRKIAKKFNVAEATISDIKIGRAWKHVAE